MSIPLVCVTDTLAYTCAMSSRKCTKKISTVMHFVVDVHVEHAIVRTTKQHKAALNNGVSQMQAMKISFTKTEITEGFGKIRMETTVSGVVRVKPTNRVKSRDLADLLFGDLVTAIIPARYFAQATQAGKSYEADGYTLEKNAHGWYSLVPLIEGQLDAVLYEAPVEAPQGTETASEQIETFDANIGIGLYPVTNPHYNPVPLAELLAPVTKPKRSRAKKEQTVTA